GSGAPIVGDCLGRTIREVTVNGRGGAGPGGGRRREAGDMSRAVEKVKEEVLAVLPPTLFFFVSLHIVAVIRTLMARSTAYQASSTVGIGVAALILGEGVLVAAPLPPLHRFPGPPLLYNVTPNTALYLLVATAIHFAERVVEFGLEAGSLAAGWDKMVAEIVWPHFWAIEILLLLLVLVYCTARELIRVIGREKMIRIFFGPLPLPEA